MLVLIVFRIIVISFYILAIGGCTRSNQDIALLNKAIEYDNKAIVLINKGGSGFVNSKDMERIVELRKMAIIELKKIDTDKLNKLHKDFGFYIKNYYVKGLELFVQSYDEKDYSKGKAMVIEGQQLLEIWGNWFEKLKKS